MSVLANFPAACFAVEVQFDTRFKKKKITLIYERYEWLEVLVYERDARTFSVALYVFVSSYSKNRLPAFHMRLNVYRYLNYAYARQHKLNKEVSKF